MVIGSWAVIQAHTQYVYMYVYFIYLFICKTYELVWWYRRELLWPELDKLLLSEADASVATPYTAAVLEYRVTFYEQTDGLITENSFANGHANGNTAYDAQHPCRYELASVFLSGSST